MIGNTLCNAKAVLTDISWIRSINSKEWSFVCIYLTKHDLKVLRV